ncbi:MAG: EMC3/TMCO1 family protein [Candidatus Woesearchaeota archaeon]
MAFETILNPIMAPLLGIPSFWSILIISLVVAVLITLVYKWMTDQHLMRALKEDIKKFQKQMKELKDNPKEFMAVQKRAMETNMKYMMHSMKPTLVTFIPIILIFGWLNANIAFEPILPDQEFTTTAMFDRGTSGEITLIAPEGIETTSDSTQEVECRMEKGWIRSKEICESQWILKGVTGNYLLEYEFDDQKETQELLITEEKAYEKPVKVIKEGKLQQLKIDNEKVKPIPGLPIGWLGTYIIFSIIFSMTLRKIMKLH